MKTITMYLIVLLTFFMIQNVVAQEDYQKRIEILKERKAKITLQEKEALKYEVENINERLQNGTITADEANLQKQAAAEKRALNIENRITIIENQIHLLERNEGKTLVLIEFDFSFMCL